MINTKWDDTILMPDEMSDPQRQRETEKESTLSLSLFVSTQLLESFLSFFLVMSGCQSSVNGSFIFNSALEHISS